MSTQSIKFVAALLALTIASAAEARGDKVAGAQKAEEVCATCHGMDGNGIDPSYPRLAGQYADYMAKTLEDYRSGARQNAVMAGFATTLTDDDIENLAAYYASLEGLIDLKIK